MIKLCYGFNKKELNQGNLKISSNQLMLIKRRKLLLSFEPHYCLGKVNCHLLREGRFVVCLFWFEQ